MCGTGARTFYDHKVRQVRDLSWGDPRVYVESEVRRVWCQRCGAVKQEQIPWLAANPFYPKRFAFFVGQRGRTATVRDVARELHLEWKTVKEWEKQYMREPLRQAGTPGPRILGSDEMAIRKGHTYRIVVSDLLRRRVLGFGGHDRSEASLEQCYAWVGQKKAAGIRLAVMEMWKPFRNATTPHAPQAAILCDKFPLLCPLGDALDTVRKAEYRRLSGKDRRYIKGQKYTLLARRANLTKDARHNVKGLLAANKRLNTASWLKESCGQLGDYKAEGWARRFFENWRAALKWQRLKPDEKFAELGERHWEGIATYCHPDTKGALGFVEGLNNKIRVIQRRAYGLRDEEDLRLKILTCMLPVI